MNARVRTILILGVVFLALAGTTVWLTSTPTSTGTTPTAVPTVIVWDAGNGTAEQLTVASPTGTIAMQIVSGTWQITAPVAKPGDDLTISEMAGRLKKPDAISKVGDNLTDLTQYGLAPPAITVTLVLSGATPPRRDLLIGKQTVDGAAYYAHEAGSNTVYLISNATIEPLKGWITAPPIAQPTPTPLALTVLPSPALTNTTTLTGTTTGPATPGSGATTPGVTGTQPPVGASPVSTLPAGGAGASPAPSGSGGGSGGATGTVSTPTP